MTTPATPSLTQRYIAATTRSLPPGAQDDVRAELEASIADAVETRTEQGEDPAEAERAVLTELGDPAALAAGYTDQPLQLIGPRHFLAWWRLLKLLLMIVPACVVGGVALGQALAGASFGDIIGEAIPLGISVILHLCFWVTFVFAVLERTGAEATSTWDVDQLPEAPTDGTSRSELVASLVFLVLSAAALFWDRFRGFVWTDGEKLAVLHPDLWPWGVAALLGLIALEAALALAVYVRGRWTAALATLNSALALLFVGWALSLLARQELVNPALVDVITRESDLAPGALRTLAIVTAFAIVAVSIWDIVDGWRKTRRDAR
ncbi:permease prefix domain 1-containing protein [Brachybacterium sp. GCM10030267]|uniref:permease prefix domain 1-containing protein n=1 Tax=Brachybacterium sp. GCM10030267 TaxID=3273381 RepID=UPI00360D6D68